MFDVIHSIAGYHHYTPETRRKIHKEMNRILKPNGLYVIADVAEGSEPARCLNGFVDTYCPFGHKGMFLTQTDIETLKEEGYDVKESHQSYTWDFHSWEECFEYTKSLFYLTNYTKSLDEFKQELKNYLTITEHDNGSISWNWSLLYLFTTKTYPSTILSHH